MNKYSGYTDKTPLFLNDVSGLDTLLIVAARTDLTQHEGLFVLKQKFKKKEITAPHQESIFCDNVDEIRLCRKYVFS